MFPLKWIRLAEPDQNSVARDGRNLAVVILGGGAVCCHSWQIRVFFCLPVAFCESSHDPTPLEQANVPAFARGEARTKRLTLG
jgi:hypothetical protein